MDRTACAPSAPGALGGQTSFCLTLGPVILSLDQGLALAMFLEALPIPLYHTVPPGRPPPHASLVTDSLGGVCLTLVLNSLAVARQGGH